MMHEKWENPFCQKIPLLRITNLHDKLITEKLFPHMASNKI